MMSVRLARKTTPMATSDTTRAVKSGRIKDARGHWVTQLDPVRAHLLHQTTVIPTNTLRTIADDLLPGARRQRLIQVSSVVFGFLFVIGGNVVYFRYFSSWKGLDPVNLSIYALQILVLLAGPVIAIRMARTQYLDRVAATMLSHLRCPHCGYDIHSLPPSSDDGATVCPECGCAWAV